MRNTIALLVLITLVPALAFGNSEGPLKNYPVTTGEEQVNVPVAHPPYVQIGQRDPIGTVTVVGTTWYDIQHNGTVGRMIEKSTDGYLDLVWMNGLDYQAANRHIYYNFKDPITGWFWPGAGYPVETSNRAGYTTMDVDYGGRAFPCFHWTAIPGGDFWTATATDFFPHTGTFITYEAPHHPDPTLVEIIWPRIQFDNQQAMQIISTENTGVAGDPQRHFWERATYDPLLYSITYDPEWQTMTWTMTIAGDVATSDVSNKCAYAWAYPLDPAFPGGDPSQWDNDCFLVTDDDGIDPDWLNPTNITSFYPPDPAYLPDTVLANQDTFRVYTDLNVFIDMDDYTHVVLTTPSYFSYEGTRYWHASLIWHWSEQYPDDWHLVHNAFDDWTWNYIDCGAWNVKAQRPQIAQDPTTGYFYCMYQVYDCDTLAQSAGGWPSGEIFVSMSQDGGVSWSEGINITQTITPMNAAPGQCLSEITPSMAKLVDGELHIMYVLDKDAGTVVQTEGTWTLNDVIYHNVPVDLIPATPLEPDTVLFHVITEPPPPPDMIVTVNYVSGSPIPAGGGTLYYGIWGENQGAVPLDFDIWIDKIYESTDTTTLILREITNYLPGWQINRPDAWYPVPGAWPGGNYDFRIYTGWHPEYTVWHTDAFSWVKDGPVDLGFDFEANLPTASFPDPFDQIAVTQEDYTIPTAYEVMGAYPNPFNPATTLSFALPQDAKVLLSVYDVNGRLVSTLVDGYRPAGVHDVTFDGSNLASGVYLYRLEAGDFNATGKMILMK